MTIDDVKLAIEEIRRHSEGPGRDPERAHSLEDELWFGVLTELSEHHAIAREALKTKDISFSRWCA